MSPTSLIDLPNETLLDIIAYQDNKRPTSLICKRLNTLCGPWIFERYNLQLSRWNGDSDTAPTPLAHLREMAPHVRELIIHNSDSLNDVPELFPEDIIPDLEYTLAMCTRVTTVRFKVAALARLPVFFWGWFANIGIYKVDLGCLAAPEDTEKLKPLDCITSYEGGLYDEARPFLEFIDPIEVKLNYTEFYIKTPMNRISLFKPAPNHFHRLTTLNIELDYPKCSLGSSLLFDFANIPQASINITFYLHADYVMGITEKWFAFRQSLSIMFGGALSEFNFGHGPHVLDPATVFMYRRPRSR